MTDPRYCWLCEHYHQVGSSEHTYNRTPHACNWSPKILITPVGPTVFYEDCRVRNHDNMCVHYTPIKSFSLRLARQGRYWLGCTIWFLFFVGVLTLGCLVIWSLLTG